MRRRREEEEEVQVYCLWTRPGGQRCRAYAQHGSEFCYWHDPDKEEERRTGFRPVDRTPKSRPILPRAARLESAADVHRLLAKVANYLATADRPDVGRAQTLSTTASCLLRALDLRRLESELEAARAEIHRLRAAGTKEETP